MFLLWLFPPAWPILWFNARQQKRHRQLVRVIQGGPAVTWQETRGLEAIAVALVAFAKVVIWVAVTVWRVAVWGYTGIRARITARRAVA